LRTGTPRALHVYCLAREPLSLTNLVSGFSPLLASKSLVLFFHSPFRGFPNRLILITLGLTSFRSFSSSLGITPFLDISPIPVRPQKQPLLFSPYLLCTIISIRCSHITSPPSVHFSAVYPLLYSFRYSTRYTSLPIYFP